MVYDLKNHVLSLNYSCRLLQECILGSLWYLSISVCIDLWRLIVTTWSMPLLGSYYSPPWRRTSTIAISAHVSSPFNPRIENSHFYKSLVPYNLSLVWEFWCICFVAGELSGGWGKPERGGKEAELGVGLSWSGASACYHRDLWSMKCTIVCPAFRQGGQPFVYLC